MGPTERRRRGRWRVRSPARVGAAVDAARAALPLHAVAVALGLLSRRAVGSVPGTASLPDATLAWGVPLLGHNALRSGCCGGGVRAVVVSALLPGQNPFPARAPWVRAHGWSAQPSAQASQSDEQRWREAKQQRGRVSQLGSDAARSLVQVDDMGHDEVHFARGHFRPVERRDAERLGVPAPA